MVLTALGVHTFCKRLYQKLKIIIGVLDNFKLYYKRLSSNIINKQQCD